MNRPLQGELYFDTQSIFHREQSATPRKLRVLPWVIVAVNVLFLAWIVFGVKSVAGSTCTATMTQLACDAARAASSSVGTLMAGLIWVAADVILGGIMLARTPSPGATSQQLSPS